MVKTKRKKLTEVQLYREIDKLLVHYAGKNLDGDPHITFKLIDRRVYDPMPYSPVPMIHRPLYYRPDLGEVMTEKNWQESLHAAISNVGRAANALDIIQKCYEYWRHEQEQCGTKV